MVLVVNGQIIGQEILDAEAAAVTFQLAASNQCPGGSIADLAREWAIDNVIERVLLQQAAVRLLSDDQAQGNEDGKIQRLLDTVTTAVPLPKRREVVDFYNQNRSRFRSPETFRASHIVKNVDENHSAADALAAIHTAAGELSRGEPFAQVADRYSDCPGSGGELDWFPRGEMVEEFESVITSLKPGQVSQIFRSQFGFHIAMLHGRKPSAVRPLSEVFAQIENDLLTERRQAAIHQLLDRLRSKATIETRAFTE